MEIILILLLSILVGIVIYMVYVTIVYNNTNDESDKDTNDKEKVDIQVGDVFVYEPLSLMIDPFEDVSAVSDVDSRTYIVDDLKTNYFGVVWVKYHTLISHRRKKCFYHTASIDAFLFRTYKRNDLKHLFE